MAPPIVTVKYFARRQEGGKWRFWGWGLADGREHTFWMLDRQRGFTFKPFSTYANTRDIEAKVAEQQAKGYAATECSRYYQTKLDRCFGVSMIAGTLHVGRGRR